jgi:type IV pilus assembly protein PilB
VPLVDLLAVDLLNVPMDLVDSRLIRKHHALPLFRRGNRLFVAVSDPTNDRALDEIRFNTGMAASAVLAEEDKLTSAIHQVLEAQDTTMSDLANADLEEVGIGDEEDSDKAVDAKSMMHLWCAT